MKNLKRKEKINFLLENKHYKRLHLILYLLSVLLIVLVYFITILTFSSTFNKAITAVFALFVGIYLVFNRDKIVKIVSERVEKNKRKQVKKENKVGLKTTLKKITPKRNVISVKGKVSVKERLQGVKSKFKKQDKEKKEYLEIK